MSCKLDGKFHGIIVKNKDQSIIPQDQWVVFLAKDNAFPATLKFYLEECKRQGAGYRQIQSLEELIKRVEKWRSANYKLCKIPDVEVGEIIL